MKIQNPTGFKKIQQYNQKFQLLIRQKQLQILNKFFYIYEPCSSNIYKKNYE